MTDPISQFIDHLTAVGAPASDPSQIHADDKIRRFHIQGDRAGSLNGRYALRVEGDFACGWVVNSKEGTTHAWHTRSSRKMSPEERAEHKRRAEQARRDAESHRRAQEASAGSRATAMWGRASKAGSSAYTERKGIRLNGARLWRDLVIVPVRRGADIVSLQFISPDGSKRFLKGGAIDGCYFSMATSKDDLSRIVICEGYATGCTIRQAIGLPVIVAFNAGNLKPVALSIRAKYPDAEIIIAGDSDQWTARPDGSPWNPGVEKAQEAAVAIGGARVLTPTVPHDHPERPTDWNDVGEAAVIEAFNAPIPDHREDEPAGMDDYDAGDYEPEPVGVSYEDEDPLDAINPQGHNEGVYYFYPVESGQITGLTAPGLNSMQNLYRLAPRSFWETAYGMNGKAPDKQICALASAHLMDACHKRGIYLPETTRGVGVWIDNGKVLVNTGDTLVHEGREWHPARFRGEYVYESGPRVMRLSTLPLRNAEADLLRQICRMLSWKRPLYADLLAGWLVVAMVGGALHWRPHIWLSGESGSGKSTVMKMIISAIMKHIAIIREGGTTEAAVRKALGRSSRAYVLDEAESEGVRAKANMQAILTVARIASSGGLIENANDKFRAQSCFCFSSINPGMEQLADESRITLLSLEKDRKAGGSERYERLLQRISETITPEYSARLMARTVANMDALLANIATYSTAAAGAFGSARAGDQMGPLLAGAFSLTSTRTVTLDEARSWIAAQEWSWHEGGEEDQSDSHRCLARMMLARVRYDVDGQGRESSVGELVDIASKNTDAADRAQRALRGYGFVVKEGRLFVANQSPPIARIMADSPWTVWKSSLERLSGAEAVRTMHFAPGLKSRAVSVPLVDVLAPVQGEDWDDVQPEDVI